MSSHSNPNRSTDRLPIGVFAIVAGFVLWMVLAAWAGFAGSGYSNVALTVVSGLLLVAIAIPFVLWRMVRANDPDFEHDLEPPQKLSEWSTSDFETWQDHQKGSHAAAEIILPIAAAAVGMTAFAIVFHYAAMHAT